jgi:type IV pilus assembly protein PilQ
MSKSGKEEVSAMGDVEMTRGRALAGRLSLLLLLVALVPGCRSARPAPAEPIPPERPAAETAAAAEPDGPAPLRVTAIEVREAAPGTRVEVASSEPLIWTSFRDAQGRVVVELPNAVPGAGVGDLEPAEGLVERVGVSEERAGRRPLTRLTIVTREEVEHSLSAEGTRLLIGLTPVGPAPGERAAELPAEEPAELAFEPLPEQDAEVAEAEEPVLEPFPAPSAPVVAGTADQPMTGPAPTGAPASRLGAVEVQSAGDVTVIEIQGDGEFSYSTFRLSEPERFVVDLAGVVNGAERSVIPVASGPVERVRVAQFRPFPEPVSRVVFDLREPSVPAIERTPDSLVVRFREGGPAPSSLPLPAPPPPEPEVRFRPEPPPPPEPELRFEPEPAPPVGFEERYDFEETPAEVAALDQDVEITNLPPAVPPPAPDAPPPRPVVEIEEPPLPVPPPSDASLFDATEIRVDRPGERDERGLVFGTRQLGGERVYFGEPIDMSLKDADVVETLRSFAQISGLNIVIQPEVEGQGRVTVELHDVPWDQALEQILKINNLGYEVEGNIMRIAPLPTLRQEAQERQQLAAAQALSVPLETVMKRLSYSSAANIAAILRRGGAGGVLSQRGNMIVDQRTNTLIISELPEYMDTVLAIIENLDEPEPQVMIEARIIETTKRFSRELGIAWGFDLTAGAGTGNTTGLQFPNNLDADGSVNLGSAGQNGLLNLRFGNILNTFELDLALNAAEEDGLVNILSTPKVATLNNHQATIQSGLQVPIQTVANNTVTVQFVNATLRLEVTPQITADGTVVMDIFIQKREVQTAFLVPGATNAPIATKEAETQVLVRDGGTAVIGGIYEVSTDQSQQRVPGLANIPILGQLFRNRNRTDENEELLIFITPRVVRL